MILREAVRVFFWKVLCKKALPTVIQRSRAGKIEISKKILKISKLHFSFCCKIALKTTSRSHEDLYTSALLTVRLFYCLPRFPFYQVTKHREASQQDDAAILSSLMGLAAARCLFVSVDQWKNEKTGSKGE